MPDGLRARLDALLQSRTWEGADSDSARALLLIDLASKTVPAQVPDFSRRLRAAAIRAEFNGSNHRSLADRYNLTARQIRRIVRPHRK